MTARDASERGARTDASRGGFRWSGCSPSRELSEQRRTALINATHNERAGQPSDIAETAYFLASDGARHITGQPVHVNGGAHTTR